MRLLAAAVLLLQSPAPPSVAPVPPWARPDLRADLDTLYAGQFAVAAAQFERLAARDTADPAPLVFQAGAYIWWAAALDSIGFERRRIDSLLGAAIARARAPGNDFWLATALGYRAREREIHGQGWGAAKDAKAMRDAYRRVLAADSSCVDCYLGLGLYSYGLARVGVLTRFVARLIGLGSGNVETGLTDMRHVARDGALARVEGSWVLAAALMREAARDESRRPVFEREARALVLGLRARFPENPVFVRFLTEVPARDSLP